MKMWERAMAAAMTGVIGGGCLLIPGAGLREILPFAVIGAGLAGAGLAAGFGRAGRRGWAFAGLAAVAATLLGGGLAGALVQLAGRGGPGDLLEGGMMGAVMGGALVLASPFGVMFWCGGFAGLHLWRRQSARLG